MDIPCCCRWHYFILFNGWVISHYIYLPHLLYPFFCRWTFMLLPCLGYCKQWCNGLWGACILWNHVLTIAESKKKMIQVNLFTKCKQTHRLRERIYGCHGGRMGKRDRLRVWNWHVHTAVFKIEWLSIKKNKCFVGEINNVQNIQLVRICSCMDEVVKEKITNETCFWW